jgi:hypothetical protein
MFTHHSDLPTSLTYLPILINVPTNLLNKMSNFLFKFIMMKFQINMSYGRSILCHVSQFKIILAHKLNILRYFKFIIIFLF